MEGSVQSTLFDLKSVVGGFSDPPGDGVAVERFVGEGFEDEDVQGALKKGQVFVGHLGDVYLRVLLSPLKC